MKKKFLAVFFGLILMCMIGCGAEEDESAKMDYSKSNQILQNEDDKIEAETIKSEDGVIETETIKDVDAIAEKEIVKIEEIGLFDGFHDDVAWVTYDTGTKSGRICINRDGKALFQLDGEVSVSNFSNDSAFFSYSSQKVAVIDKAGTILRTIDLNHLRYIFSDYVVDEIYVANFNENYYQYVIYNKEGEIVFDEKYSDRTNFGYAGQDVLVIKHDNNIGDLYFIKYKSYINNVSVKYNQWEFGDENFIIATTKDNGCCLISSSGEVTQLPVVMNTWGKVREGVVVYCGKGCIGYYDIERGEVIDGTEALAPYFDKCLIDDAVLHYKNGIIPFQMKGEDGNTYVAAFDRDWQEIIEPTKVYTTLGLYWSYPVNGICLHTENGEIYYSSNGDILFTSGISIYDVNGINFNRKTGWYDSEGNKLYDTIDITNIIEVSDTLVNESGTGTE